MPVSADAGEPASDQGLPSPFFIAGAAVFGIGVLLLSASFFAVTTTGRWIDVGGGLALCIAGWALYRKRPTNMAVPLGEQEEKVT